MCDTDHNIRIYYVIGKRLILIRYIQIIQCARLKMCPFRSGQQPKQIRTFVGNLSYNLMY